MIVIYKENLIPPEKLYPLMGKNIKNLRMRSKMTQEQLAEQIDMDQKQISHIETGRSREKLSTYLKIANVFGVSIDQFLADALLIDAENLSDTILFGEPEQRFIRDVIHATLNYIEEKET